MSFLTIITVCQTEIEWEKIKRRKKNFKAKVGVKIVKTKHKRPFSFSQLWYVQATHCAEHCRGHEGVPLTHLIMCFNMEKKIK